MVDQSVNPTLHKSLPLPPSLSPLVIFILELKVIEYGPEVFSWVIKSIFLADGYGWIVKFRDRK